MIRGTEPGNAGADYHDGSIHRYAFVADSGPSGERETRGFLLSLATPIDFAGVMSSVIDWEQLDMIADGFTGEFVEIYQEFVAEIPGLFATLQGNIESADTVQAARTAHQLKGSSANFGFIGISQPMSALEQEAKGGSLANAPEHLASAQAGFSTAVLEVKEKHGV
jgi:HPt (histidine-containing phosphotransfer) domain-containing protein